MKFFSALKQLLINFIQIFGVIWLIIESIALFNSNVASLGYKGYFSIIILSIVLTLITYFNRKNFCVNLREYNIKIKISTSDIFRAKGNIIIGSCDTFDTELGDIINPKSLIGQLQTIVFNSNRNDLDSDLEKALTNYNYVEDSLKTFGKNKRYPLGTTPFIKKNGNLYFLLAFCSMKTNIMRVSTDVNSLWDTLLMCWKAVRDHGSHNDIHIPVIGSKFARTGISYNLLIQLIIMTYLFASKEEAITGNLTIHVHKGDYDNVDFISLKNWLKSFTVV